MVGRGVLTAPRAFGRVLLLRGGLRTVRPTFSFLPKFTLNWYKEADSLGGRTLRLLTSAATRGFCNRLSDLGVITRAGGGQEVGRRVLPGNTAKRKISHLRTKRAGPGQGRKTGGPVRQRRRRDIAVVETRQISPKLHQERHGRPMSLLTELGYAPGGTNDEEAAPLRTVADAAVNSS